MNKFNYTVQGVDYEVEINEIEGNVAKVTVNGIPFEVEMKQPVKPSHTHRPVVVVTPPAPAEAKPAAAPAAPAASQASAEPEETGTSITAPLPGTITDVNVSTGDVVKAGDTVVVLEAMKMQNNIEAETAGTIKAVKVSKGDSVLEGTVLVVIG